MYSVRTVMLFFLFSAGLAVHAQTDVQVTGTLYVSSGTDTLYVSGNFTSTSTASLTNNGNLYVKQNLSNGQASMAIGTGTLYLNGSSAQSVNGSQQFRTYNFVSNNGAGITLNNDLSVSGAHTFINGLIASSATPNYLVYEAGSSYSGDNDSRHVTGWVKKFGNTAFAFPVGDASYERTVAISALSATAQFNCHYYRPTQNVFNLNSPVVQVKANEYWQLDKITGGTAKVTLNWNNAKVPMDNVLVTDILAAEYLAGAWGDAGGGTTATGTVATTGSVTSGDVTNFAPFTLGYKSFPVPLKLISFTAERRNSISYLQWITENEQLVDHFEIQRSSDAVHFSIIGSAPARNSGSMEIYNYEDHFALNEFAWYRIRSVDVDGKFGYSRIAVVSETDRNSNSFVIMNPVSSALTIINKTGADGKFEYRLFNSGGQLMMRGNVSMANNGSTVLPLPFKMGPGIYLLELANDKIQYHSKILVEK